MLHFIPAWYHEDKWCETEQLWYKRRMRTEFDDTVKQVQLFHRNKMMDYQILLLSFAPNFRHFLHRQGVYHAPYWSVFDCIGQVKRHKAVVLSFHNLNWPENIEFVYNSFLVMGFLDGVKYAQIEFGEDGNPIQVDLFQNGIITRRNLYDDRGFVASSIVYGNGEPLYQDYLLENGIWAIRQFLSDGHVEVNPKCGEYSITKGKNRELYKYRRMEYEDIGQIIEEILQTYISSLDKNDIFCIAMHNLHAHVLNSCLNGRNTVLSFFENRFKDSDYIDNQEFINKASFIITDSKATRNVVKNNAEIKGNIVDITPYDSRVDFGISQQMSMQKIMVPVDGMREERFQQLIAMLALYISMNENAEIHLFTRNAEYYYPEELLEEVRTILVANGQDPRLAASVDEDNDNNSELDLEEENKSVRVKFFVNQCVDELSVSRFMREQRVMVDVRANPDLYLQISCISIGIPQIVVKNSEYVTHEGNGIIISSLEELQNALNYFLDGLAHWNEALVYSYELGKQYTTEVLLKKWKGVIDIVGKN